MKISTRKDVLESILINAQAFLERKDPTNITSHIYLNAELERVTIKATDSEIGLEVKSNQLNGRSVNVMQAKLIFVKQTSHKPISPTQT